MLSNKFQEIEQYKAKLAQMEKAVLAEREAQLKRLHLDLGFASQADLIQALRKAGSAPAPKAAAKAAPKAKKKKAAAAPKKQRRKRAKVTEEMRKQIAEALAAGGKGAEVAAKFDVSVPTVNNIKKAAGLVKKRAKAAAPAPAEPSAS
jgi:transposase